MTGAVLRGRYRPHARGFGFLTPVGEDGASPARVAVSGSATVDRVFVPPALAGALVADDLVEATVTVGDKGAAAERVAVVARPRRLVVGVVERRRGRLVIAPDGAQGTGAIACGDGVARTVEATVGDLVAVLLGTGEDGTPVAQALVAGPYRPDSPEAVRARAVIIVLGGAAPSLVPGGPGAVGLEPVATETIHVRVMGQLAGGRRGAAAGLDRGGAVPGAGLEPVDRRGEPSLTVDAATSRELDDAVAAAWDGDAGSPVRVAVHITDVAGGVGPGSPADSYARTVAATAYLAAARSAPMLDPELSEGSSSLLPGEDRSVLSVRMAVLPGGTVEDVTLEAAVIRSHARLTYGAVEQWLGGHPEQLRRQAGSEAGVAQSTMTAVAEAARRLGAERDARMTLEELFAEPELVPSVVDGRVIAGPAEPHARAYRLIERLMVAANEIVGGWLVERGVPALYRTHEGIASHHRLRLQAAAEMVRASVPALAAEHGDPERVTGELLAEIDRLAAEGLQSDRDLLISAATSSTARAAYDPDPSHHRGLAASAYCHFTSPLRRYADLVVHRQVRAALAGEPPPYGVDELRALSGWLSARAGALSRLETRERADLWGLLLQQGEVGDTETATITGLTAAGMRVRLARLGLSGFVLAEQALGLPAGERATLEIDQHGLTTTSGPWRVGGRVTVRFAGLDDTGRPVWQLADRRRR